MEFSWSQYHPPQQTNIPPWTGSPPSWLYSNIFFKSMEPVQIFYLPQITIYQVYLEKYQNFGFRVLNIILQDKNLADG